MNVPWEIFAWIVGALLLVISGLIGLMWHDLSNKMEKFDDNLNSHKLWAADNYIKKDDCKDHRDDCHGICVARREQKG